MARFGDMPGWTRPLMGERKFRKAVIRAARERYMTITARWDRGNAWSCWQRNARGWRHSKNGMLSQEHVPVEVSGETFLHFGEEGYGRTESRKIEIPEAAWISFWDWNDDEGDEDYCPSLKSGKRCRKMGGTPCPFRLAAGGNHGIMDCDASEAVA